MHLGFFKYSLTLKTNKSTGNYFSEMDLEFKDLNPNAMISKRRKAVLCLIEDLNNLSSLSDNNREVRRLIEKLPSRPWEDQSFSFNDSFDIQSPKELEMSWQIIVNVEISDIMISSASGSKANKAA